MTALLGVLVVVVLPVGALIALLKAVDLIQHRRAAVVARRVFRRASAPVMLLRA